MWIDYLLPVLLLPIIQIAKGKGMLCTKLFTDQRALIPFLNKRKHLFFPFGSSFHKPEISIRQNLNADSGFAICTRLKAYAFITV